MLLSPSTVGSELHLTGWRDAWWRARDGASAGVNDGNSIARALGKRLVQLHLVLLVIADGKGIWCSREDERRRGLGGVLKR